MVEVDQHHHAGLRRDAGQRDEADRHRHRQVVAQRPHQPHAADQRERDRQHDDQGLRESLEVEVQQQEDRQQRHRNDDLHLLDRALHVLELAAPGDVVAGRKLDLLGHRLARVGHVRADVAATDVDEDVGRQQRVLGADARRAARDHHLGHLPQRHHRAAHDRHQHLALDLLGVGAQLARVAHRHAEALAALDGGGHHFAAERGANHIQQLAHRQAITRQLLAVGLDVEIAATGQALGEGRGRARHVLDDGLDLLGKLFHLAQVLAEDLDADRRADAGGQHVQARLDRHRPGVGHTRELQRLVQLGDQFVGAHARPPLGRRLQVDDGLEHLDRCRVGGGVRTPGLAVDRAHLGEALDDLVLRLQHFRSLGDRHARQRGRHVQQRALVERGHELAAQLRGRVPGSRQRYRGQRDGQLLPAHHGLDDRAVEPDQEAVHRVLLLRHDLAANEQHHQHWHQGHRQQRRTGHRKGLGVGQRREQAALLRLEREHGQEGHRDDQQREEQRRPDLLARVEHGVSAFAGAVIGLQALQVLVGVFDHHDGRVDHRANGDRDAAQAHDVGVHAQQAHRDE